MQRFYKERIGAGPVLATAIHAGHQIRDELLPWLVADAAKRRRDEDPLTDVLASTGDSCVIALHSRFEVDLNRPRERALAVDPADTWGIRFWRTAPPDAMIATSQHLHDAFYRRIGEIIDTLLANHGRIMLLDIHSYNHRRAGPAAAPDSVEGSPDIDVGITELSWPHWGEVVEQFAATLSEQPLADRRTDVRFNVRYPDGGHFPEWVSALYAERVCTLTLEYKKMFMDEWSGVVDLGLLENLRAGLGNAIDSVRHALSGTAR